MSATESFSSALVAIDRLVAEFDSLGQTMSDPDVYNDPIAMKKLGKRRTELEPIVELAAQYRRCQEVIADSERAKDDPELVELAEEQAHAARERMVELEALMKEYLIPKDPLENRNVILEVRAGTGGDEASLFAAELLRMYLRYAEERGWTSTLLEKADADLGGIKEAVIEIAGSDVYGYLKFEGGVHRVQRIPATESKGRVHTSAATVAVLPEAEEEELPLRNEDLRIDTFRAGGAGGQHVNKTESAVRITHVPSGIVVSCQSERSQLQNRARAMELLRTKLYAFECEKRQKTEGDLRSSQIKSGDRSEKIRTYNFPQDRLTDHRIGQNFYNLPGIMEGGIGSVIEALRAAERAERLSAS